MGNKLYEESSVQAIATAIRAKNGSTNKYKIAEMGKAVGELPIGSSDAVLYTAQTLTFEQKQQARKNIEALPEVGAATGGTVSLCPDANDIDSNNSVHVTPTKVGGDDFTITLDGGLENAPIRVKGIRTPTDADTDAAATVEYVKAKFASDSVTVQNANLLNKNDTANQMPGKIFYVESSASTFANANADTAIYFPVGKWGAGAYKFPIDYIQYAGNAAYRTALFNADKGYIKTKTSTVVNTDDTAAYILSLDITQAEIDSGAYYIGLSIRTSQLGASAMVVKDMDYPASYIEYGTTTYKAQKLDNGLELSVRKTA